MRLGRRIGLLGLLVGLILSVPGTTLASGLRAGQTSLVQVRRLDLVPVARRPAFQSGVEVVITDFVYDQANNRYDVALSVAKPEEVAKLVIRLEDQATGERKPFGFDITVNRQATLRFTRDAASLQGGQKYSLIIQGVDQRGNFIRRGGQGSSKDDDLTLARRDFAHPKQQAQSITFKIDGVNGDTATGKLLIKLFLPVTPQPLQYEGGVVNKSGARVLDTGRKPLQGTTIEEQLPATMRQTAGEYKLTLRLFTSDNQLADQQEAEFTLLPPPSPGLVQQGIEVFKKYPVVPYSILGILALTLLVYIVKDRLPKPRRKFMPPIPNDPPSIVAPRSSRLRLCILQSPGIAPGTQHELMLPCVLGRGTPFQDESVSRKHARVMVQAGHLCITDLGSTNGTYIGGKKLPTHQPVALNGKTRVRLGQRTECELELIQVASRGE